MKTANRYVQCLVWQIINIIPPTLTTHTVFINYGGREIPETLDGENFENQNQFATNFIDNTRKAKSGLELATFHTQLKAAQLCLPYS